MGVYIIGEKMPTNCTECFKHNKCDKYHIEIVKNEDGDFLPTYIADNCPLIEVTEPHGNLIDYNFVYDELEKICTRCKNVGADRIDPKCDICWVNDFLSILNSTPTVIEAEGE